MSSKFSSYPTGLQWHLQKADAVDASALASGDGIDAQEHLGRRLHVASS
ncbi:hypothetical protein [Paracoccus beibuensis]|nr:hypothetical protein [Paracoccus beibuensis]